MAVDYLKTVAANLRRTIPAPREIPAKPQASWHLLKPGQRLRSVVPVTSLNGAKVSDGALFEVVSCSNKGTLLRPLELPEMTFGRVFLTDPEWKSSFERVRVGGKK